MTTPYRLMPHLDLSDEEAAVLIKELHDTTDKDRYPFSERVRTLKVILGKLRRGPRELLPSPTV
jgi:hypothetical protein